MNLTLMLSNSASDMLFTRDELDKTLSKLID